MFDFKEWLSENTYFGDPDSVLVFCITQNGDIEISSFDATIAVEGRTLEEACRNFSKESE